MKKRFGWKQVVATGMMSLFAATASAQMAQAPPVPNAPHPYVNPNAPHPYANPSAPHRYYDKHHPYATRFGDFLDSHPSIESDLTKNPRLADNPKYLEEHPELRAYLKDHPDVRAQLHSDPYRFMHRVHHTQ
ncbi:MAG TPA: hypothetical protein VFB15_01185 [Candidatus Binataceae bacterium]|jgi:hypothetical protein|nr:hypothetical protein [Candidatus Binataceae bacterium]